MRNAFVAAAAVLVTTIAPAPASGFEAHRYITRRAIDLLPPELGATIEKFGMATLKRNGMVPWRASEIFGHTPEFTRFERDLFEKSQSRLTVNPAPPSPMLSARDAVFDALPVSYQLVDPILKADSEAVAGKDVYDADYFETLFTKTRPILERRLADATSATAGAIVGAWEQAGRPTVPTEPGPRPTERVRKPQP